MSQTNPSATPDHGTIESLQGPPPADQVVDITADICPMTFVRTRLALDRLPSGSVLLVRLRGEEPRQNVPRSAEGLGHQVLASQSGPDGVTSLWIRRA